MIPNLQEVKDQFQRQVIALEYKNREFEIEDKIMRPVLGYDLRKIPGVAGNPAFAATITSTLDSAAWENRPVGMFVMASITVMERWGPLTHASISVTDRHPTWQEISALRDLFFPDTIDVMMLMPKREDYVNVHEHCFHIWQTPQEWGIL